MKKVLFSHSYFLRFDPKQWEAGQPYPPLGTLYAASLLRKRNHQVYLFDTMFANGPDEILPGIEKNDPDLLVLYDDGFNYLTKMCLSNMRQASFKMIKHAKKKGCVVIVSSSDASDHYERYLQEGADFVLIGEAENSLCELTDALEFHQPDLISIPGIAYKKDGATIKTAKRPVIRDLDALPFPAWDLVDMPSYRKMWLKHRGYFSLNMTTTRGCPFKCNWCAKPIYGNRYNSRSPANVVAELLHLKQHYHFDHIWFCDDIFGLKPGWVQEFAGLLQKAGLRFPFKIQARADLLVQENYVRDLARAGCDNAWLGAESGSQRILDAMDKGTTIGQIKEATGLLKKHDIRPSFFIQFGYPGETRDDIGRTIEMINELLPDEIGISVSYPLPGTVFYERVKSDLQSKTNWTDSNELALMFRNTFSPAFYKQLYRYVHKSHRLHISIQHLRNLLHRPHATSVHKLKKSLSMFYYAPTSWIERIKLAALEIPKT
jgi:radical SAM superfamily enzyme YgiQ (UPF0313 family)